jgi:hypothetical protein
VAEGLGNKQPEVFWQALPASYQNDVQGLVRGFADSADPQLWNQTFQTLNKLIRVLDEKRDFIFQQPLLAARMESASNAPESYDGIIRILQTVTTSEISDLEQLRNLDIEGFLAGPMASVLEQLEVVSQLAPESTETVQSWKSFRATVIESSEDTALLRIESDGEVSGEEEFVRVEGKWVPRKMAESWESSIADARKGLTTISSDQSPEQKQQMLMFLAMADGVLDSLLSAETQEQFNGSLSGILGLAMSQMQAGPDGN